MIMSVLGDIDDVDDADVVDDVKSLDILNLLFLIPLAGIFIYWSSRLIDGIPIHVIYGW